MKGERLRRLLLYRVLPTAAVKMLKPFYFVFTLFEDLMGKNEQQDYSVLVYITDDPETTPRLGFLGSPARLSVFRATAVKRFVHCTSTPTSVRSGVAMS